MKVLHSVRQPFLLHRVLRLRGELGKQINTSKADLGEISFRTIWLFCGLWTSQAWPPPVDPWGLLRNWSSCSSVDILLLSLIYLLIAISHIVTWNVFRFTDIPMLGRTGLVLAASTCCALAAPVVTRLPHCGSACCELPHPQTSLNCILIP